MVDQVKAHFLVRPLGKVVLYLKEKPLNVSLSVYVILKNQIVFTFAYPNHGSQVSRLEPRVKNKTRLDSWLHWHLEWLQKHFKSFVVLYVVILLL